MTYWDRLGWRDTLGNAAVHRTATRWYAGLLGKGLYTPQLVLGGELDLVGSDPRLEQALTLVAGSAARAAIDISAAGMACCPRPR